MRWTEVEELDFGRKFAGCWFCRTHDSEWNTLTFATVGENLRREISTDGPRNKGRGSAEGRGPPQKFLRAASFCFDERLFPMVLG